jgi:hypothetical protein
VDGEPIFDGGGDAASVSKAPRTDATRPDVRVPRDAGAHREASFADAGATDALTPSDATTTLDARSVIDAAPDAGCDSGEPGVACVAALAAPGWNGPIAVDDTNVYWTSFPTGDVTVGQVMRRARSGGAAVTLVAATPLSLVSDGVDLYGLEQNAGRVLQIPVSGGAAITLAQAVQPLCVAVDDTNVYWTDGTTGVERVAKSGGVPSTLASGLGSLGIVLDATNVYWTSTANDGSLIGVVRANKTGGDAVTLLSVPPGTGVMTPYCRSLGIHGDTLYLAEASEIVSFPADAGTPTVVAPLTSQPRALAVDSTNVFWLLSGDAGVIQRTSLDGGPVTMLLAGVPTYNWDFVVASDGTLYWDESNTGGQVLSLAP